VEESDVVDEGIVFVFFEVWAVNGVRPIGDG